MSKGFNILALFQTYSHVIKLETSVQLVYYSNLAYKQPMILHDICITKEKSSVSR